MEQGTLHFAGSLCIMKGLISIDLKFPTHELLDSLTLRDLVIIDLKALGFYYL